ncbi:MAG: HlyD family secretion protein [Nitrospirae bacterium]|nr:HlyD family secretion protein [Nitrospirota bacterium]MCL5285865.1 HlyD family secretion protein [Nitrospirota bacterium]
MNSRVIAGMVAGAIVLATASFAFYHYSETHISTEDAQISGHLHPVTTRISGSVMRVLVHDNQVVHAGDLLFELDDRVLVSTKAKDEAALARDEAQLEVNRANTMKDQTTILLAKRESDRTARLSKRAFATASRLDRDQAAYQVALANLMADTSFRKVLESTVRKDKARLDIDLLNLRFSKIRAPVDGLVTGKTVEKGQFLSPGQVVGYVVPFRMWVIANYKETELHGIHPGDPVQITVDAIPGKTFRGHVDSIQLSTGAVLSLLPPENATGNYTKVVQRVPVKILLDPGSDPDHQLRLGMSVIPVVLPKSRS